MILSSPSFLWICLSFHSPLLRQGHDIGLLMVFPLFIYLLIRRIWFYHRVRCLLLGILLLVVYSQCSFLQVFLYLSKLWMGSFLQCFRCLIWFYMFFCPCFYHPCFGTKQLNLCLWGLLWCSLSSSFVLDTSFIWQSLRNLLLSHMLSDIQIGLFLKFALPSIFCLIFYTIFQ